MLHDVDMISLPCMIDMMDALRRAKLSLCIESSSGSGRMKRLLFSAIIEASLLKNVVAARPIPPVVDSTSSVKVACSISHTRWSYCLIFFSSSSLRYTDEREP